ncbi:MAG: hypothetical protein ACTSWX_11885 [Promethearchaeota archaeon]
MGECKLSNNLIEGFLFEYLGFGKKIDEIYDAILERFGTDICAPDDLNSKGIPKYKSKTHRVLENGKHNGIYIFDDGSKKYHIPE